MSETVGAPPNNADEPLQQRDHNADAQRVRGSRSWIVSCVVALALVTAASAWWMTDSARDAMTRQVIATETTAATERAAQVSDAIAVARERLAAATALPAGRIALERRDAAYLQLAIVNQTKNQAITRISVTTPDGTILARSPLDQPAVVATDDDLHLRAAGEQDARFVVRAPFSNSDGTLLGWLNEEQSLSRLVPRFTRTLPDGHAGATLVTEDGTVLLSGAKGQPPRLRSPDLVRLVTSRRSAGLRYHSRERDASRIAATAPVPGRPWVVVVDAAASTANHPAGALVARLLAGFAVTVLAAATILAAVAAAVVTGRRQLQRAHERSLREATTDSLTGVLNRRAFDERLAGLRGRGIPVGIAIVDIDGLKAINDTRGHAFGDLAICDVADCVRRSVRSDDLVFRIGGDEFAVVVAGPAHGEIMPVAARISAAVGDRASVGAADGTAGDVDETFRQADAAMYRSKRGLSVPSGT